MSVMDDTTTTTEAPEEQFPIQSKFDALETILNVELVERKPEIRASILTLVAGTTLFMLGSPGVGKSYLTTRLTAYIKDARYFNILMTKFTQPEEVFGPFSLKALDDDKFERVITSYLPDSELAMVDEIFKANSSILNAFLWAINERIYRHGTEVIDIPLSALFCASNELPADDSLAALYDRLLFRFEVAPVRDQRNFIKMMRTRAPKNPEPILEWHEIKTAQDEAAVVVVPDPVFEAMAELRKQLKEKGIEPTERRFVESLRIIRAAAWLDGRDTADVEDMRPLEHVMWEEPEQHPTVKEIVLAMASPLDNEANKLLDDLVKLEDQLDNLNTDDERHRVGNEVYGKVRRAKGEFDEIKKRAGSSRRRSEVLVQVHDKLGTLTDRVLEEVFKVTADDIEKP